MTVRRRRTARIAHVTGHVSWWVFVVGLLIVEMETFGLPRRYADYAAADSLFGTGLGQSDFGWTAYTPLTDGPLIIDSITSANIVATVTVVALAVTVLAAVVDAVAVRRWPAGIGTVLAPVLGAAIILMALQTRSSHFGGGLQLNPILVFAVVLVGVAIREVWSRRFAPRLQRET